MDNDAVKAFNAELVSLYEMRPPISKKKIVDITKAAMKAIKYYKHVVFGVEKFLTKCKQEYKIPGLYCIDSIIRQSRHQFKDRDVFAPRFSNNLQTTLSNLLNCRQEDKLKVVRVLNLWKCHGIFDENQVITWLQYCRDVHGLETDLSLVEKVVKGDQANMSIYTRGTQMVKIERRRLEEPQTPPPFTRNDFCPKTPPLPIHEPSDDVVDGGVSEREILAVLTTAGFNKDGAFSSDYALLQKVHEMVNSKLLERRELDFKRQGNIKNLLSREFDYSDEDDSGDDESSRKMQIDTQPVELTKQQIMGMAEAMLREPDTKAEITRMHNERLSALTQAAAARVQAAQQNAAAAVAAAAVAAVAAATAATGSVAVSTPLHSTATPNTPVAVSGVPAVGVSTSMRGSSTAKGTGVEVIHSTNQLNVSAAAAASQITGVIPVPQTSGISGLLLPQAASAQLAAQVATSLVGVSSSLPPTSICVSSGIAIPTTQTSSGAVIPPNLLLPPLGTQLLGAPPLGLPAFLPNMPPPFIALPPVAQGNMPAPRFPLQAQQKQSQQQTNPLQLQQQHQAQDLPQESQKQQIQEQTQQLAHNEVHQRGRVDEGYHDGSASRNADRRDRDERRDRDRDRREREDRRRDRSRSRDRERDGRGRYSDSQKRSRRSRSRDRGNGEIRRDRDHCRNGSGDRRGGSRGRDRGKQVYKEVERERRKMGLPWPAKEGHLLIASRTLWLGRIPSSCSEEDIRVALVEGGEPSRISIISSRACAYVTMQDRKSAYRIMDRMQRSIEVAKKNVKLNWGIGQGLKGDKYSEFWDADHGYSLIPYSRLPDDLDPLVEGGHLDVDTLPSNLAGLYDENGRVGKPKPEPKSPVRVKNVQNELQIPPGIPPFPFPPGHFFPPGLIPMPSSFPPGLAAPAVRNIRPVSISSGPEKSPKNDLASTSSPISDGALSQHHVMALSGMSGNPPRIPVPNFDRNGIHVNARSQSGSPLVPPNFANPPPSRFHGAPGFRHRGPPLFGGGLHDFQARMNFDPGYARRPPFRGPPPNHFVMMGRQPGPLAPFMNAHIAQSNAGSGNVRPPLNVTATNTRLQDFEEMVGHFEEMVGQEETKRSVEDYNDINRKRLKKDDACLDPEMSGASAVNSEATKKASEEFRIPEEADAGSATQSTGVSSTSTHVDDTSNEPVTSTTHDDENIDTISAISESIPAHDNDDLKPLISNITEL